MDAILGFFSGIASLLSGAFDFLLGILRDLAYIATLILKAISSVPAYFRWLPAPVVALLVTIFGVVAIYKILGREG